MSRYRVLPPQHELVEGLELNDEDYKDSRHAVWWRVEDVEGAEKPRYFPEEEEARAAAKELNGG